MRISGQSRTTLKFTDNKDLANFQPGDVVGVGPDTTNPKFSIDVTNDPPIDITGNLNTVENSGGTFVETAPANSFGITNCWYLDGSEDNYLRWSGLTMPTKYTLDYYFHPDGNQVSNARTLELGSSRPYDDFGGASVRNVRVRQLSGDSYTDYSYTALGDGWNHIRVSNTGIWHNGNLVNGSPRDMAGYIADKVQIGSYSNVSSTSYKFKGWIGPARLASVDLGAPPAGGLVLKDSKFGDPITVTSVDADNNTMFVSGGTWNNGDVVTGPVIPPATGVVSGQPANSTINLGTTDGRWIVDGGLTVLGPADTPATYVESYLTWDNSNVVTGMTSVDPGFDDTNNLNITFPATAPSGDSWDVELPPGTYMQTRVQASNDSGTADTGWSNVYTPRASRAADYNADEAFAEKALRILTFENRKHVYCGQQAEAKRDAAIQSLADQGYTLPDILKYL